MSECTIDGKTTGDGYRLCYDCGEALEYDLAEVSGVLADLGAVVTRKAKGAPSVGGPTSGDAPLPLDLDAMGKGKALVALLASWVLNVADDTGADCPSADPGKMSDWLRVRVDYVRRQDYGADMRYEVRDALNKCRRASDRVDERIFAGKCPECGNDVMTRAGNIIARCSVCETEWDVSDWRERALEYAGMVSGTASQLSRMLTNPVTGENLPRGTILSWASRGKLEAAGANEKGHPVYYVDDVRQVWADMQASKYGNPKLKASA